jgi:hypothetical protein
VALSLLPTYPPHSYCKNEEAVYVHTYAQTHLLLNLRLEVADERLGRPLPSQRRLHAHLEEHGTTHTHARTHAHVHIRREVSMRASTHLATISRGTYHMTAAYIQMRVVNTLQQGTPGWWGTHRVLAAELHQVLPRPHGTVHPRAILVCGVWRNAGGVGRMERSTERSIRMCVCACVAQ